MTTHMRHALLLFSLLTLLILPVQAQTSSDESITETQLVLNLRALLDEMVANDEFSGTVALAYQGESFFEANYGYANRETRTRNTMDTAFSLASMNKMFTSVAVAQLVEQGLVDFSAPISTYLDDLPEAVGEITVHQLLTHSSGLADYFQSPLWEDYVDESDTVFGYFPLFINEPLHFEAGTRFEYSNSNFIVLGAIIELASGQDYFDYIHEHIYEPAWMLHTDSFTLDELPSYHAVGYTYINEQGIPDDELRPNSDFLSYRGSPAGGGYGSVPDLIAFSHYLFDYIYLSEEMTHTIITPQIDVPIPGLNMRYAYGFEIKPSGSVGHSGGFPGVSSAIGVFPESGYSYVVLSNTDLGGRTVMMKLEEWFTQFLS